MLKNALYLRLSLADGDLGKNNKDESNSIENQRTLLVNFLQDRDDLADEYIEYADDGYTGTNFERPEFKRMIEDAKAGKIDTIIVKTFPDLEGIILVLEIIWSRYFQYWEFVLFQSTIIMTVMIILGKRWEWIWLFITWLIIFTAKIFRRR